MSGLTDLQAAVAALHTEVGSVVTYLQGLPAAILALQGSTDPDSALATLAQQVQTDTASLTSGLSAAPSLSSLTPSTTTPPTTPTTPTT